jgi:hypothetical protein
LTCQLLLCQKEPKREFMPNLKSKLGLNLEHRPV